MLSPAELRDRYRGRPLTITGDDFADLCEQVAELREQAAWPFNNHQPVDAVAAACSLSPCTDVWKRHSPRILKASEITEPGWYLLPLLSTGELKTIKLERSDSTGLICYTMKAGDKLYRSVTEWQTEFYGPIQLPE